MAERGTTGHGEVNAFFFPVKSTTSHTYANCQLDRLQSLGLGPADLSSRKVYEIGRDASLEEIDSPSVDKPFTVEFNEHGAMRIWNLFAGKAYNNSADIDQDDFKADLSEGVLLVHKLDSAVTNILESHVIWPAVVDSLGVSVPNSKEDDVSCSIRCTGDHWVHSSNGAAKIVVEYKTVTATPDIDPTSDAFVERDDWPDDESQQSTELAADPGVGATEITVDDVDGAGCTFKIGHHLLIYKDANNWETTKATSVNTGTNVIGLDDALDNDYAIDDDVKTTRGFTFFVYNATDGLWLDAGDDYRVVCSAGTTKIINIDGGTKLAQDEVCVIAYQIASAGEEWTDNDTDLNAVQDIQCKLVVSPNSDFSSSVELCRGNGYDVSVTCNRTASYESGVAEPVYRSLETVDVRCTFPAWESDETALALLRGLNADTVKDMRPEQSPAVYVRLEVYETSSRLAGDIKVCYEMPEIKLTSHEMSASAGELATKRLTLTGGKFVIASAL